MSDDAGIPTLTDLIESGDRIDISELGLDDEFDAGDDESAYEATEIEIDLTEPDLALDPFENNPALEHAIHEIIEKHMREAWQEIKIILQRELNKP